MSRFKFRILNLLSLVILFGMIHGPVTSVAHNPIPSHDVYPNLTMDAVDQPMVDQQVCIRVTFNDTAVVVVTEGDTVIGHGVFAMPGGMTMSHSMELNAIPSNGTSINVLATIKDNVTVVGKTLTATVYHDYQGDGMVNGTDDPVLDASGNLLSTTFQVTEKLGTGFIVADQEINLDDPFIIVSRVVVPGPAWLVVHGFDKGALGPMFGIKDQIRHGVNIDVQKDFTQEDLTNMGLTKAGDSVKVFAHVHHDLYNRGYFNMTEDTHIRSPEFNDEILGNDSAQLFTITVVQSANSLPLPLIGVIVGVTVVAVFRLRSINKSVKN